MRLLLGLLLLLACVLPAAAAPRHVIVIVMENKNDVREGTGKAYVYGNDDAPFINGDLAAQGSRAAHYVDDSGASVSQPHYIEMLAGRSSFSDADFVCDNDPLKPCRSSSKDQNWTASHEHLVAQIDAARTPKLTWMAYQEGIDPAKTGACPISSHGLYVAKHNPFVYLADVAGAPPSADNAHCAEHMRELGRFAADMQAGALANFVFITPNLCNDMHGALRCPNDKVRRGDEFLGSFLPPVLNWAKHNDAVVFIVWDESGGSRSMPFFAAGAGVKQGYVSKVEYSHASLLRTIERIFGLPILPAVRHANDLEDMFEPGVLP